MSLDTGGEYIATATKASPPVAYITAYFAGMDLQQWVLILTAIYTALQLGLLLRKIIQGKA